MKVLKLLICASLLLSETAPLYAEGVFDKPLYQSSSVRPLMRTPQEIIADFQVSVERIQKEQRSLYGEIESKNRENALLLKKINDLTAKLREMENSLSKKVSQDSPASTSQVVKLLEEKNILLKKYNETLSQKQRLESEIEKLSIDQGSVEEKVQAGVAILREALNASSEENVQLKAQKQMLASEKDNLQKERRQALEERSVLQGRIQSMEVQIQQMKENAAEASLLRQSPLQLRIRELSDQMDEMRVDLREKNRLIADAKKKESIYLADLNKIKQEKDDLKEQIQKLTSTYNTAQEGRSAKISRLESMIQEKQKEIDRLSASSKPKPKSAVDADPGRKELQEQISLLKDKLTKEQAAYEFKLAKSKDPFILQIQALQKTLDQKTEDLSKKNKELESLRTKSRKLSKELDSNRKEKEALGKSVQAIEKKAKKDKDGTMDSEGSLRAQILSLKQELDKREEQFKKESGRVDALQAQKEELSIAIESVKREKVSLQEQLASYKQQAESDKVQLENNADDVREEYGQKLSFLSAEIKELEKKLSAKEQKIADQVKEADRQKEDSLSTIASLERELEKQHAVASLKKETAIGSVDQNDEIKKLTVEKQELEKELRETDAQRGQFEEELAALKIKYEAMEADISERMRQARAPLEEAMAELRARSDEQIKILEDKERLLEELRAQDQAREAVIHANLEEKEGLNQKIIDLEGLLEKARSEASEVSGQQSLALEKKTKELNNKLDEANTQLKKQNVLISELKNKNDEFDSRSRMLEKEKSEAQRTVTSLNEEIAQLKETAKNDVVMDLGESSKRQIAELKSSLTDNKQALKIQENLVKTLNAKIADLGIDVRELTDEGVELRSALSSAKEEKSRLEKELNEVKANFDQKLRELPKSPDIVQANNKETIDIEELKKSSSASKQALKVHEDLIKTLNAKIADLGIEIKELTEEAVKSNDSLTKANEEKARLQEELRETKTRLKQESQREFKLPGDFQRESQALQQERNKIQSRLDKMTKERNDLLKQLEISQEFQKSTEKDSQGVIQKYQSELNVLKEQNRTLGMESVGASERATILEKTIANLNIELEEARKGLLDRDNKGQSAWQDRVNALTAELKNFKENSTGLERSVKDLQKENEELNLLLEESRKSLSQKDRVVSDLNAAQAELSAKTAQFEKEREAFESRIKALTQELASVQSTQSSELTFAKSESAQKTAQLAKKLADSVSETRAKEVTIAEMIVRQKSLERELSDAVLARSRAEASENQIKSDIETLRKDLEAEKNRMKDEVLRFGNERDDQIIKVNELQNALKDAQNQIKLAVQDSSEPLTQEIGSLKGQIQKNESELQSVRTANEQLNQTKVDLISQLAASQLKQKDLQDKFEEWKNAISENENKNRSTVVKVEQELNAKISDISSQLEESNRKVDELTKLKTELEKKINDQGSRISKLDLELAEKNKQLLSRRDRTTEEFSIKQKDLQAQLENVTEELNDSKISIAELIKAKDILQKDLNGSQFKVTELESELKEKQANLEGLKDRLANDLVTSKKTSDAKIEELTGELATSRNAVTELRKLKEGLEGSLKEAQDKIAEMSKDVTSRTAEWQKKLSDQEKELKASQENVRAPLTKEIDGLKKNIDDNIAQIETLSKQNKELTVAKEEVARQLAAVEAREKENQIKMAGLQEAMLNKGVQDRQALITIEKDLKATIQDISSKLSLSQTQAVELSKAKDKLEQELKVKADAITKLEVESIERQNSFSLVEAKAKEEIAASKKLLDNQISQLNTKIKDSEEVIFELRRSKESVEEELRSKEARIVQLEKESSEKADALALLKAQSLKDVDSAKQELNTRIEQIAIDKKEAEAQVQKLSADLQSARGSIDDLAKSRESLEDSIETKDIQIKDLQAQIIEKDKAASILKAQLSDELTAIQNKLNDRIENLSSELASEKEALGSLTRTKEGLEAALKASEAKLISVNSDLVKKEEAIKAIEDDVLSRVATAKKPLEEKIDILVKSLGDAQAEVKTKQGTIEGLSDKVSAIERSLSETSAAKANFEKESVQAKAALEQTRKEMTVEIQKANEPLVLKNKLLQNKVDEDDTKITFLTAERDRLLEDLEKLNADGRKLQQDAILLKQEIENQKRSLTENAAIVRAPLLAEIEELKKTLSDKERLIEQKSEAFSKVSEELATVLKGLAVIREERDKMSSTVKPLQDQIKSIPQEVALAKAPLERENSQLKVELAKVQGMLDVRVQGLEADLVKKTNDFQEAEAERRSMEKEIARVSRTNEELTRDMEKFQLKLSQKFQEECGVALEEIQKPWKDKIDQLKSQLEGRDKEIESFKNENLRLNQELGSLMGAAGETR